MAFARRLGCCLLCLTLQACVLNRTPVGVSDPDSGQSEVDAGALVDAGPLVDSGPELDGGSVFDATPRGDGGCEIGATWCESGSAFVCDETGRAVGDPCEHGCSLTAPRCARLEPSHVERESLPEPGAHYEPSSDTLVDTGEGCPGVPTGALCVMHVVSARIPPGVTLTARGRRALALIAVGDIEVAGTIDVSARGVTPGPAGELGGDGSDRDGRVRELGGEAGKGSWRGGGGGGGALCGRGGPGGDGDRAAGGAGGIPHGSPWDIEPLTGGHGGGAGAGDEFGRGGAGGGALQLTSLEGDIVIAGDILAGGGGGQRGRTGIGDDNGAGGGGGSGGFLLFEAFDVRFSGGRLRAAGGGGAGGSGTTSNGSSGTDGAENDMPSGGSGGGSGGSGGSGGGIEIDGAEGASSDSRQGGGGGGGAGCLLIRNRDGTLPVGADASVPRPGPAFQASTVRLE